MKVFIIYARENWITDVLVKEWCENNKEIYTNNIKEATIIWILSDYIVNKSHVTFFKGKKVITTIHHIVPFKVTNYTKTHFKFLNSFTSYFQTNNIICKNALEKYVNKSIKYIPLWNNEKTWYSINNKSELRKKYNIDDKCYLIGSFQGDTEGASIANKTYKPKLEKGPDIFVKAILQLKKKKKNIKVVLTGRRRHYIMKELKKIDVEYYYFEMCDFKKLNELYNCLDLYIVGSRVEGGPRAINECSLTKTPLFSTDVGIASLLCYPKSIYNMNNIESILECKVDIEYNYEKAMKYSIKNYMKEFNDKLFFDN